MSQLERRLTLVEPFSDAIASIADGAASKFRDVEPYVLYWWLFTACVAASNIHRFAALSGPLYYVVTIAGTAGCGWAWLFSRALFRPAKSLELWPILGVGVIATVESYWQFTSGLSAGGLAGEMRRIGENAASLICICAIALVFVEALSGFGARLPERERRFRRTFVFVFGAMIAVGIVWASNADEMTIAAEWRDATLVGCSLVGVIAGRLAIGFRRRNPLLESRPQSPSKRRVQEAVGDGALAQRILDAIENEKIFTTPNLKIAAFAELMGEQEYKITQCITGSLRYRNFNHFINSYRIEHARRALSDARNENRSVLSIAFDCGFNSIGPFNRAFKQHVGMTPREFRASFCKEPRESGETM